MVKISEPSGRISASEFERPAKVDPLVFQAAGETRLALNRPMLFSVFRGSPRHPKGDAVAPNSTAHADDSLHKFDIDHDTSARVSGYRRKLGALCRALDWDCMVEKRYGVGDYNEHALELFEIYLEIERLNLWTGIGLYPTWNNPGFHTDLRSKNHPSYTARWYVSPEGLYKRLSWGDYKADFRL